MTATTEKNILNELKALRSLVTRLLTISAGSIHAEAWIPLEVLIAWSGWSRKTIHNYASQGKILKRGALYSYKSFLEYCGVYRKEGTK